MKVSPDLSIPEILAIAIKAEINAQAIYRGMASRVKNELVREKLEHLYEQEKKHEEILTQKYREVTEGEEPVLQKEGRSEIEEMLEGDYSHEAALKLAIEAEEKAAQFYLDAARQSRDPNGRFMFEYLANFERGHKAILEDELQALENNPHWFDVEGNPWGEETIHVGP
jgi:rubrerythrin